MKEKILPNTKVDYEQVVASITSQVRNYLIKSKLKSVIMGVSGGLDSGINTVILSKICRELRIPLIGRFIQIESNKEEERLNAERIGKCFCDDYKEIDLTDLYLTSLPFYEENKVIEGEVSKEDKIRRGNIKARMRMIHLFNLSQEYNGLVIDNDNLTERSLGFWTIYGDVGCLVPLADLFKTEVYELAKWIRDNWNLTEEEKTAINGIIEIVPTDGLGITSSDVEQFGCDNYAQVDDILLNIIKDKKLENYKWNQNVSVSYNQVQAVRKRHENSEFKRNIPFRIKLI